MPNTEGLELLARKKPLTAGEWHQLIEARHSLIKPHLNSFTLSELGDLKCLRTETFSHELRFDSPTLIGDERFSLKTQGIFDRPYSGIQRIPDSGFRGAPGEGSIPDGKMYIWGLTRNALWVLVEVTFKGEVRYKRRGYEKAETVDIQESDLITIVDMTKTELEEIWKHLGETVKGWVQSREHLYNVALELGRIVEIEELILSTIQDRE